MTDNPVCWIRSGTGSGANTIASGPSRRTWTGSAASYCITTRDTPATWGSGGRGLPDPPRGREGGVGLDAEPGESAVLFLYKEVLGEPLPWLEGIELAKRPARLPVVLTRAEVESILAYLSGTVGLILYGTAMRIMQARSEGRVAAFEVRIGEGGGIGPLTAPFYALSTGTLAAN